MKLLVLWWGEPPPYKLLFSCVPSVGSVAPGQSEKTNPICGQMSVKSFVQEAYDNRPRRGQRENKANRRALAK